MKIIFCGQFSDASGYGNAARYYLNAFHKNNIRKNINFYIFDLSFEKNTVDFLSYDEKNLINQYSLTDINIKECLNDRDYLLVSFQVPHIPYQFKNSLYGNDTVYGNLLNNAMKNINMVVWETDKVPDSWINIMFDNIIVPCDWNYDVFSSQTKSKVYKLPYPLQKQKNKQYNQNKIFDILSISQWSMRKGFDTLIKAYSSEFYNHTDTCLTIKTYRNEIFNTNKQEERDFIINDVKTYKNSVLHYGKQSSAKIKLITDVVQKQQIEALYDEADVFCLATRGEGFGLTIAEAASKGLPCIVPNKGGHIDFLDRENNFLYDSYYSSVLDCNGAYSTINMKYVESYIDDLRLNLRKAYDIWYKNSNNLIDTGLKSKIFIDKYLDDVTVTDNFIKIMQRINNE